MMYARYVTYVMAASSELQHEGSAKLTSTHEQQLCRCGDASGVCLQGVCACVSVSVAAGLLDGWILLVSDAWDSPRVVEHRLVVLS